MSPPLSVDAADAACRLPAAGVTAGSQKVGRCLFVANMHCALKPLFQSSSQSALPT